MDTDLTFITNEKGHTLLSRFNTLIKGTKFFDCLVGYFYTSGFNSIYKNLEDSEKIRILIGISTDKKTHDFIQFSKDTSSTPKIGYSHSEAKIILKERIIEEFNLSKDSEDVAKGVIKFIEWLKSGKLEIKVYPTERIHSKIYIMTLKEDQLDKGRVITGSSNFTKAGLSENLEFNVELKDRRDYEYALSKFNELWKNSIDVSKQYVETIRKKTWLNDEITPYELFLKFLYEYLKDQIQLDKEELKTDFKPNNFLELEYQKDAVRDAKKKLEEHGGVFISDVVGLGKTYIATMLAQQLEGGTLVIAPPFLIDKKNPGSWRNAFYDFGVSRTEFESIGKLDQIIKRGTDRYQNVIIDEAHRFRTESTQMYEKLFTICRGKRVILVTATPLNNTPLDILAQIKLFQNAHKSTLPNPKVRDLEKYFKRLQHRLKKLNRQKDKKKYLEIVKENSEDIRENILKYLMVRRTRTLIEKYYNKDLKKQKMKFPTVQEPEPIIYNFSEETDKIFKKTIELVAKKFKYSRYTPLLYLKEELSEFQQTPQKNMGKWMKILLLKRLESSFFAFKKSISRFINHYNQFLEHYEKGHVYISKDYTSKIFELLSYDDIGGVEKLIEQEKAKKFKSKQFTKKLYNDLKSDLKILNEIQKMWSKVNQDPKLDRFINLLTEKKHFKESKLIVFTESKETGEYLEKKLKPIFKNKVLAYSGSSPESTREKIIENFDPASNNKKNNVKILITTEILSEGVNLNRSNVVINYDIPWNPIRMMQRVGRINRVGKKLPFDNIYTYNFFPAGPINKQISLTEAAEIKIQSFIEMLGNDAKLLTDEDIKSHELFKRLNSKEVVTGEDVKEDPELEWLLKLRELRDNNPKLFEKIKRLPKKSRTARQLKKETGLFTFFRKGNLTKFYHNQRGIINELDFENAAKLLSTKPIEKKQKIGPEFYKLLQQNKEEFNEFFIVESNSQTGSNKGTEGKIKGIIKALLRNPAGLTDNDETYLQTVLQKLKDGSIPKNTLKRINNSIKKEEINPLKILTKIKKIIPEHSEIFKDIYASFSGNTKGPKEIILSELFTK